MICEACKKKRFKEMLIEKDKAMKRYTKKLREEKYGTSKQTKRK